MNPWSAREFATTAIRLVIRQYTPVDHLIP